MAWVEMVHSETGSYLTVDVSVLKQGNSLGVHFKQEFVADKYQVCFVVESVAPYVVAEVRPGDILVAIDGKKVTSLTQISKCTKQAGDRVPLRLERRLKILPGPPSDDKRIRGRTTASQLDVCTLSSTLQHCSPSFKTTGSRTYHRRHLDQLIYLSRTNKQCPRTASS
ncbi:PDZ domain-containing protein 8 [Homalodisca vitripennis]|nr:PDZ domain-containing protein 8 [Homalodisca vitripennis]